MKYKNNKLILVYYIKIIKILILLLYFNDYTNIYMNYIYINIFFL